MVRTSVQDRKRRDWGIIITMSKKKKKVNRKLSDAEQEIQQLVHRKEVDAELEYEGHGVYGLYIDGELVEAGPWDELILKYEDLKGL